MKTGASDIFTYAGSSALVIDDDSASRDIAVQLLTILGLTDIVEKASGKDAIAYLNANPNWRGIILCDWNMAEMTGTDVYDLVKQNNPDTPFIMITGRNDEDSVQFAKDSGIYAYLLKPYSIIELERKISKVATNHAQFLAEAQGEAAAAPYNI